MKTYCKKCRESLIVPAWTYCQKCTPRRWRLKAKPVDPYKGVKFKVDKEKATLSRIMVYDEKTLSIIGYLKPRFRMKD